MKTPRSSGNGSAGESKADHAEIQQVSQEILRLVAASRQGHPRRARQRRAVSRVAREMVQGINEMLDAILLPIGEGNRILAQISSGKIDELITQTYQGDHEKMKLAVNNVGTVVQGLQKEMMRLTDASREGQLSERGKPEQFRAPMPRSCGA